MKKDQISILIPSEIRLLKTNSNPFGAYGAFSPQGLMEYNLYYRNFIYPFDESMDVECVCEYGQKYNSFWHFDGICGVDQFPMELKVYSAFGELLAEKKIMIHVAPAEAECSVLCIGDSMTRAGIYITQMAQLLPKVKTVGLRCYDGEHFCEGRGGWRTEDYFQIVSGGRGVSPFLFPRTVEGDKYLGDAVYWKLVAVDKPEDYSCVGMQKAVAFFGMTEFDDAGFPLKAKEGDVVYLDGLYRRECGAWVAFEDEFAFDFSKYMKRNSQFWESEHLDAVSILLGANDMSVPYEMTNTRVDQSVERFSEIINSVKKWSPDTRIILNLPIIGAGTGFPEAQQGGRTVKCYRYNILSLCEKILEKWDTPESKEQGIYVCPMLNFLDMEGGFDKEYIKPTKYSEKAVPVYTNTVHPSNVGYRQMGDVLAGMIAYIQGNNE